MSKNILVAEDDNVMLHLLKYKLEKSGYTVVPVSTGVQVRDYLLENTPDLIILDLLLPLLNGFELLGMIRTKMNLDLPILVISATPLQEIITKSLDLGANDFIAKPFNPSDLVVRVEKLLSTHAEDSPQISKITDWGVNLVS